jgi:hypothetical protein
VQHRHVQRAHMIGLRDILQFNKIHRYPVSGLHLTGVKRTPCVEGW